MPKILEPLPYYKWLWRDWRANRRVQRLHYVAKGLYRELLDEQWSEGFLPSDVGTLADICGCPLGVMQEHWPSLQDLFETQEDGSLVNHKLEQQRTEEDSIRAAKARGGKKSALVKFNRINKPSRPLEESSRLAKTSHIAEQSRAEQSTSEQGVEDDFVGQENLMKLKTELTKIAAEHGAKAGGFKNTWDTIRDLGVSHGTGAVATDFAAYMEEYQGDDFPSGAVVSYLRVAADRLTADSAPSTVASKDPRVTALIRELTYLSDGKVTFQGRHKVTLSELLETYTPDELISVFQTFIGDKDLEDPYTLKFIAQNYLDAADGLAYTARRKKTEAESEQIIRAAAIKRLQEEAESELRASEAARKNEEEAFNPLKDVV
jgi:uncharacterized protein YdaU (DUF1376 family)